MAVSIDLENGDFSTTEMCTVCYCFKPPSEFHMFSKCHHRFCTECINHAYHDNIASSAVNIQCLQCKAEVEPEEVKGLISTELYEQYLNFSLRKYLSTVPDITYCLSPDCPFACIAIKTKTKNNSTPSTEDRHFVCQREECQKEYCNKCRLTWHPDKTCLKARAEAPESEFIPEATLKQMNAKQCPSCKSTIEKLEDGTCNEVKCTVCQTTFCWLCLQPVSEMHFMSPTGCPMYGNQRWSRRKRYCCRFWLWLLAPLGTLIVAILLFPILLVVLPLLVGYLVYSSNCNKKRSKSSKVCLTVLSIIISIVLSPFVSLIATILVVPLLLFYAYCFVPVHVCMQTAS